MANHHYTSRRFLGVAIPADMTVVEDDAQSFDDEHTPSQPYCADPNCWCHTNLPYHDAVQHPRRTRDEIDQAYGFFGIRAKRR